MRAAMMGIPAAMDAINVIVNAASAAVSIQAMVGEGRSAVKRPGCRNLTRASEVLAAICYSLPSRDEWTRTIDILLPKQAP